MSLNDKLKMLWRRMLENVKKKKAARLRIWNHFCDETPLQGFLFYRNSDFRYERAIWMALVFVCIGVTLNDSIKTIGQFMDEDILSKVTIQQNNTIVLPNPTVCVTIKFLQPSVDMDDTNGSAVLEFLRSNKKKILHIYGPLVEKQNETNKLGMDSATQDLITESNVSLPILEIMLMALATAQDADSLLKYKSSEILAISIGTRWNTTACILRFLDENELNYGDVMKTTASYLCHLSNLVVSGNQWFDWCNRHHVVYCGSELLCFRPPLLPAVVSFTKGDNLVVVRATPRVPKYIAVERLQVNFDRPPNVDFGGNSVDILSKDAQTTDVDVDITAIQYYSTSKTPCDKTDRSIDCEEKCQNDLMKSRCGCVRISSFYINCPDVTVCREMACLNGSYNNRSDRYLSNAQCVAKIEGDLDMCNNKCLKSCELLALQFRKTAHVRNDQAGTSLEFSVTRQSYLSIEQSLAMDTQTFMSNLGGNLGLYIGGTFLALIHLFISAVRLIVSLLVAKEISEVDQAELSEMQQSLSERTMVELKRNAAVAEADILALKANVAKLQESLSLLQRP